MPSGFQGVGGQVNSLMPCATPEEAREMAQKTIFEE